MANETPNTSEDTKRWQDRRDAPVAIGICLGLAFGAAIDNVGAGLAIGIAIGAAVASTRGKGAPKS